MLHITLEISISGFSCFVFIIYGKVLLGSIDQNLESTVILYKAVVQSPTLVIRFSFGNCWMIDLPFQMINDVIQHLGLTDRVTNSIDVRDVYVQVIIGWWVMNKHAKLTRSNVILFVYRLFTIVSNLT